jgi:hypothetical protein
MAEDAPTPVEIALDIDPADAADRQLLVNTGWRLVDPVAVAGTAERYRGYVQSSSAELSVAKGMYVQTSSGWLSDRSACYLASGRPVIAQDTGVNLPTGEGLLVFRTGSEARSALADVFARYPYHAEAARSFAEEHLNSDKVLGALAETAWARI